MVPTLQSYPPTPSKTFNQDFWKIQNMPTPTTTNSDIRLGDLAEACQKFTHHPLP